MNLFRKMAAAIVRRSLSVLEPNDIARLGGGETAAGMPVTQGTALSLSAVWACTNIIAGTIATLPIGVYKNDANGVAQKVSGHWLGGLLDESPNTDQTSVDFWEYMNVALELRGNAYASKDRIGSKIVALTPINPGIVQVRRENGRLRYRWSEAGVSYDKDQSEILHIRGFGGDPLGGMSTLSFARQTISLASAINTSAGETFKNGLRPSGTLNFDKFLTAEQREKAEKVLVEKFAGAMNSGRPMVLEGGSKWSQITINPEDAQMLESRAFSVEEICRFFGVPPSLIGHTEKVTSWGNGLSQLTLGFVKFTLRRRLKRIEKAIGKQLLTDADRAAGIFVKFNLEGLLRGSAEERGNFYKIMLPLGVYTINEVRALENLPPIVGGDTPYIQIQNVPLSEAGAVHRAPQGKTP